MSETFSFEQIPENLQVPGAYAEITTGTLLSSLRAMPLKALIIGVLGAGSGSSGVIYRSITASRAKTLAGANTMTARAVAAFAADAPYTQLDLVMLQPADSWTATTWTITPVFASGASNGQVALLVNGQRVPVTVTAGMNAAQFGAAFLAAFTSDLQTASGFSAGADATSGVITLTSFEKGAWTADMDVRASQLSYDVTAGVTLTVAKQAAGVGSPDVTSALQLTASTWYTDIISCLNDGANLAVLGTEMKRRYNAMAKLDAHCYVALSNTYGQALSVADTLDNQFLTVLSAQKARWEPAVAAASFAAVASAALNTDPARQLRTLELTALSGLGPDDSDQYDDTMRNILLLNGISTFLVGQDGTVTIERAVTTRKTDQNGNASTAWHDITIPKTATRVRYDFNSYVQATYPRAKLVDDGSPVASIGGGIVSPSVMEQSWIGRAKLYEQQGWIENTTILAKSCSFARDPSDRNRLNGRMPIQIVGNLIVLATQIVLES